AETRALDAAEALFYGRGVHAVGMDDIRDTSGVSLKRLYRLFPTKERLLNEVLKRRDIRWRDRVAAHVSAATSDPAQRLLAVFDWLYLWFREPGFRGCAWINTFGELGAVSPGVAAKAREHKTAFRQYVAELVAEAGLPADLADQLVLLAEGAMTTAAISGSPEPANQARAAAVLLLRCHGASV
ncbi:MAG TPA: TetR/AcrR family transcriptional regulator, partial [Pseudonocardiaceae bacterium]|nr:TetR/AcrR family transcriptional regulator [Pseudonocardiaceae bacterium]